MVDFIILSRYETMNGFWYPFDLTQNIPWITRLYKITELYEAEKSIHLNSNTLVERLKECDKGGYIDPDIFKIFLSTISEWELPIINMKKSDDTVTSHRSVHYAHYLGVSYTMLGLIDDIGEQYRQYHIAQGNPEMQKQIFLIISDLQRKIRELADIIKIIEITRHWETPSDKIKWTPWAPDEMLTPEWELASLNHWNNLAGLDIQVRASPRKRATQTAHLIINGVASRSNNLIQESTILIEKSLDNPSKDTMNKRYNSYLASVFADDLDTLYSFVTDFVSYAQEWIHLFVVHRESGRHLMLILENIFRKDGIHSDKKSFENGKKYGMIFRWNWVLDWEEINDRGLLFSVDSWRETIVVVNSITQIVFWDIFYDIDHPVNLVTLHGKFLDYMDIKLDFMDPRNRTSPESISNFLQQLDVNNLTKHFSKILKYVRVIKDQIK